MKTELVTPPGFWKTVGLLLRAARARSLGRRERQRQLLQNKTGKSQRSALGCLAIGGAIFIAVLINGAAAMLIYFGVQECQRYAVERQGQIVVSPWLFRSLEKLGAADRRRAPEELRKRIESYAEQTAEHYGGRQKEIEDRLWTELQ